MKKGSVSLKKTIVVENSNFIPTGQVDYERRVKRKTQAYSVGQVTCKKYYGLLESLSN